MQAPSKHDYVRTYFTLYERFEQEQETRFSSWTSL